MSLVQGEAEELRLSYSWDSVHGQLILWAESRTKKTQINLSDLDWHGMGRFHVVPIVFIDDAPSFDPERSLIFEVESPDRRPQIKTGQTAIVERRLSLHSGMRVGLGAPIASDDAQWQALGRILNAGDSIDLSPALHPLGRIAPPLTNHEIWLSVDHALRSANNEEPGLHWSWRIDQPRARLVVRAWVSWESAPNLYPLQTHGGRLSYLPQLFQAVIPAHGEDQPERIVDPSLDLVHRLDAPPSQTGEIFYLAAGEFLEIEVPLWELTVWPAILDALESVPALIIQPVNKELTWLKSSAISIDRRFAGAVERIRAAQNIGTAEEQ